MPNSLLLPVTGLLIVLGVLATLQYRWAGDLSAAERERMKRGANDSARRFARDFDDEIIGVGSRLRPDLHRAEAITDQISRAIYELGPEDSLYLGSVWIIPVGDGASQHLQRDKLQWTEDALPDALLRLRKLGTFGGRGGPGFVQLVPEIPALVYPIGQPPESPRAPLRGPGGVTPPERGAAGQPGLLFIVEIDRAQVAARLLPQLVARHFGANEDRVWSVCVVDRIADSLVYDSDERERQTSIPEAQASLLGSQSAGPAPPPERGRLPHGPGVRGPRVDSGARDAPGPWMVEVRHRDGSLESVVARSRRLNLALSAGILALLLTGGLLAIGNAHVSRSLARQQLEFVASVSHELNTPIAAVTSAGQNLSDGVVRAPEQVRRYGEVITREGKRLATMVEHVLAFAGMQNASLPLTNTLTSVEDIVEHAIASTAWLLEENGVAVERRVENGDRIVTCDRDMLNRALTNLIGNAVKYRGASSRVILDARISREPEELALSVVDEGLGISKDDQRRVFEPFVRGGNVHDSAVRGSGLGLSIVKRIAEAHGGNVTLESNPGRGSTFTIRIPVK